MVVRTTCIALLASFIWACSPHSGSEPRDSCCAADEGGVSLFDGKTLTGWRNYRSPGISKGWAVQDGALARVGEGAGNIITEKQFGDFDLSFEWKVAQGSNSGVFYTVTEDIENGLITSPEYQVLDNANHPDGKKPQTTAASNYALYAPIKDVTKPVGQWNRGRIVLKGSHVEHWLNGVKVVEYELGSADWKERVSHSKFAMWPEYGARRKGHIALQDHGDAVWYRDIRIKELSGR